LNPLKPYAPSWVPFKRQNYTFLKFETLNLGGIKPAGVNREMKFFVYFDAYGHARQLISQQQLAQRYGNDPDKFLQAACRTQPDAAMGHASGHVGTLSFASEAELKDYLQSLGDEITGFYSGDGDSRPYNF